MNTRTLGHFIGGEWTGASDALESRNPSNTDDVVARFPNGGTTEVDQAVAAAADAFPGWASASPEVRADVLDKVAALIFARSAELGELLAREVGKTRAAGTGATVGARAVIEGAISVWEPDESDPAEFQGCNHSFTDLTHYEFHLGDRELFFLRWPGGVAPG